MIRTIGLMGRISAAQFAFTLGMLNAGNCPAQRPMTDEEVRAFVREINAAPSWRELTAPTGNALSTELERLGREFQSVSLDDARRIVEQFADEADKRIGNGEPINSLS